MTAADYRAKAAAALLQADAATTPGVRAMYVGLAGEWTAMSLRAALEAPNAQDPLSE